MASRRLITFLTILDSFRSTRATGLIRRGSESLSEAGLLGGQLSGNRLGREGVQALAASECLARLEVFDLADNAIGDEAVVALAGSPYLHRLRVLRLGRNRLRGRAVGVL